MSDGQVPAPKPVTILLRSGTVHEFQNVAVPEFTPNMLILVNQDRRVIAAFPTDMITSVVFPKEDVPGSLIMQARMAG